MATVKVWLCDWEQQCCGPSRKVGDEVAMEVFHFDGEYSEKRHDYDRQAVAIRGRIEAIEWCSDIVEDHQVVGHGLGLPLTSTDDLPDGLHSGPWSVAFTVVTDDPLPVGF